MIPLTLYYRTQRYENSLYIKHMFSFIFQLSLYEEISGALFNCINELGIQILLYSIEMICL